MHLITTNFRDGERFDITCDFITQQSLTTDDVRVFRLLVENTSGNRIALLTCHLDVGVHELMTGERYRFEDVLGSYPLVNTVVEDHDCPTCGEPLRLGRAVDTASSALAAAADRLHLDESFGIVDEQTTVIRLASEEDEISCRVDDRTQIEQQDNGSIVRLPGYVCDVCGRHIDADDLLEE